MKRAAILLAVAFSIFLISATVMATQSLQAPAPTYAVVTGQQTIDGGNVTAQKAEGTYAYLEGKTKEPAAASIEMTTPAETKISQILKDTKDAARTLTPIYVDTGQPRAYMKQITGKKDSGEAPIYSTIRKEEGQNVAHAKVLKAVYKIPQGEQQTAIAVPVSMSSKIQRTDL